MATEQQIGAARNGAGQLRSLSGSLNSASEELISILRGNGNYQYFKAGTDLGMSVDADLNTDVDTIVNRLVPSITDAAGAIESYCAVQEELNRRRAAEAARKAAEEAEAARLAEEKAGESSVLDIFSKVGED